MSTAKVPIYLKRGSRRGGKKEKLRDILSAEMISPPLGDFRHTIHIGSGGEGDTFGDVSFLRGRFHLLPRSESNLGAVPFEFSRTATLSGDAAAAEAELPSPLLKNAISLPALGGLQALTLPPAQAPPKPPRLHLDLDTPRIPDPDSAPYPPDGARTVSNGDSAAPLNGDDGDDEGALLSHAGSLLSLHVDLGPSILDDVLQVMDKHHGHHGPPRLT